MNKKERYILILAIAVIIGVLIFTKSNRPIPMPIHGMNGRIVEVRENSIVIEGAVDGKNKIVEVIITSETILKQNTSKFTSEQIKSDKPFSIKFKPSVGEVSGLTLGKTVVVRTKENLLLTRKIEALEINYLTYDFPNEI